MLRLGEIEAAIVDLRPFVFGIHRGKELKPGTTAARRYRNRLQHALLLLNHLQADANRLARKQNLPKDVVTNFVEGSQCVRVCNRAANTHKHGVGGRSRNATMPSSFLTMAKDPHLGASPEDADTIVVGMLISDPQEGSFSSKGLIHGAARDWAVFLRDMFRIDATDWLARCFPAPKGPTIRLRPEGNDPVPQGANIVIEIPEHVRDEMTAAVRRQLED